MDYKEKFENFLNRMTGLLDNARKQGHVIVRVEDLENAFPELKESEDERIRKALIDYFNDFTLPTFEGLEPKKILAWLEKQCQVKKSLIPQHENKTCKENNNSLTGEDEKIRESLLEYLHTLPNHYAHSGVCAPEWIAWLEKQGEQKFSDIDNKFLRMRETKPANIVEFLDRLTTVEQEFLWEHIEKVKKVDREEREQKPVDKIEPKFKVGDKIQYSKGCGTIMTIEMIENGEYVFANNMGHTTIEWGNKWYLVERNLTWSEEDESRMDNMCHFLEEYGNQYYGHLTLQGTISWLKFLKDRVQPKQQWSEEDEDILNTIINHFEIDLECTENDDIIRWLKSLNPQPKQEWSEEDKKMIDSCIDAIRGSYYYTLDDKKEMEDWLKSLRSQTTWKPSEGQLECLEYAIEKAEKDWSPLTNNRIYLTLKSLKEQLEKL